jgi:hypothetical protein
MSRSELPDVLTVQDLARILRVSTETVARRARNGAYPTVPGLRVHRFPRDAVLAVLGIRDRKDEAADD